MKYIPLLLAFILGLLVAFFASPDRARMNLLSEGAHRIHVSSPSVQGFHPDTTWQVTGPTVGYGKTLRSAVDQAIR